jgi:uncharacterized protein (TIGR00288 family)
MMPTPGARLPYGAAPTPTYHPAPNAALLIDFDNVTMGIRSDLGKELKSLLKSDVIRGKVAVQRAYADWRRYPQYIVPLTESSIDLIFAPAYGSSKKNATDLRMAIDAIELVFTRPEIGTFILMTGDSDFSSCVLKLKEYGKYVIGVGMRESSSDLLIQNCDEYYSYHSLYGMTRAGEVTESREDPWVLVKRAVQQMAANGDVMRTDRLKQVMLDLDAGFDEKKVGYNKFSLFVREAANKGLIRLRRGENGQQELLPVEEGEGAEAAESAAPAPRRSSSRRDEGRRGRESRREPRSPRPEPIEAPAAAEAAAEEPAVAAEPEAAVTVPAAPARTAAPEPSPVITVADGAPGLAQAYALLQEAVRNLTSANGSRSVRDGDVKREMLRLAPGFDEETLGFSKFTRFLRQAHDAEVIDLNRAAGGNYEVSLPANGKRLPPPSLAAPDARSTAAAMAPPAPAEPEAAPVAAPEPRAAAPAEAPAAPVAAGAPAAAAAPVGALRGRRGGRRGVAEGAPPLLPGQVIAPVPGAAAAPATPEAPAPAEEPTTGTQATEAQAAPTDEKGRGRSRRGRRGGRGRGRGEAAAEAPVAETAVTADEAIPAPLEEVAAPAPEVEVQVVAAPAAEAPAAAPPAPKRGRGRGRGRGAAAAEGMPPILPGQAVAAPALPAAEPAAAPPAAEPAEAEPATAAAKRGRGRGRGKGRSEVAEAAPQAAPPAAPEPAGFSAEALGLPQGAAEIEAYLTSAYKGVGEKTAEQLLASFGGDVFRELEENPDRVRQVLGDRRANALLEQWQADRANRAPAEPVAEEQPATPKPRSRARRGGRGRGPKKQGTPAE